LYRNLWWRLCGVQVRVKGRIFCIFLCILCINIRRKEYMDGRGEDGNEELAVRGRNFGLSPGEIEG